MYIRPWAALACLVLTVSTQAQDVPFGLTPGMSKKDLIKLVGKGNISVGKDEATITILAPPRPHPDIETYKAELSDTVGLAGLMMLTKPIKTSVYGEGIRSKFYEFFDALTMKYGKPERQDFLRQGSSWNESKDWMMALKKNERVLMARWTVKDEQSGITAIILVANASSQESGKIALGYHFDGYDEYTREQKKKKESVF